MTRDLDAFGAAILGFAARFAVVLWAAPRFPAAEDGRFYHAIAQRIAGGHGYTWVWPDGAVTYAAHYPIGYPALLGALYAVTGASLLAAGLLNALLGASSVLCVHAIAATRASRGGALAAALFVALHPALVGYTPAPMTEGVAAALIAAAGWVSVRARSSPRPSVLLAVLGVLLALTTLVRPEIAILAPFFGALAWPPGAGVRRRLGGALASVLLVVAVGAPWALRNCARMDRCVAGSANAGWNLLIGTLPEARGSFASISAERVPVACRAVFGEAAKDACFLSAALERISTAPGSWLALVPQKLSATFDYGGAPGWYLHASNPRAFDDRAKLFLGVAETLFQRLIVLCALGALAARPAPGRSLRRGVAAVAALFLVTPWAWVAYLGVAVCAGLLGRRLADDPPASLAAAVVGTTALCHAVFFGAGRYGMLSYPLLAALAGSLLTRAGRAGDTARQEI